MHSHDQEVDLTLDSWRRHQQRIQALLHLQHRHLLGFLLLVMNLERARTRRSGSGVSTHATSVVYTMR